MSSSDPTSSMPDYTDPVFFNPDAARSQQQHEHEQQGEEHEPTTSKDTHPSTSTNANTNTTTTTTTDPSANSGTSTSESESADTTETENTVTNSTSTIRIVITPHPLSLSTASTFIASPTAGANVLFTGTTRSTFNTHTVTRLEYTAYTRLALKTLLALAERVRQTHGLEKVYVVHRVGVVGVGEESVIVGVSSAHRGPAWRGAEEMLERVKERAEIWKREWFVDGDGDDGEKKTWMTVGRDGEVGKEVVVGGGGEARELGEWRANADKDASGRPVGA